MRTACCTLAALLLLAVVPAPAAVFVALVGDDAACGYRTSLLPNALQSAIDAVPTTIAPGDLHVIRVARSGDYVGTRVLVEDRSLRLEGGYLDCASAAPGVSNTVIEAIGLAGGPLRVRGTTAREAVVLANLSLRGGSGTTGSGLSIRNADVTLDRVTVTANSALRGGGIEIEGDGLGARVTLLGDSRILGNTATQEGGGVYCARGAVLEMAGSTEVNGNTAAVSGGGIHLDGCSGYANGGARFNESASGGFLFARSSLAPTQFTLGHQLGPGDDAPAVIANEASVSGGGIFASGADTHIRVNDTWLYGNTAGSIGGGIVANQDAVVEMTRVRSNCASLTGRCSMLSDNSANFGGGALANFGGTISIRRTYIEGNTATTAGSAISVQGTDGFIEVRNSVVAGNAGPSVFQVRNPTSQGPARLVLDQSTIAANTDADQVIRVDTTGTVRVVKSIVNEVATRPVFSLPVGYVPETECSLFHEIASAGTVDVLTVAFTNPGFVDAVAGNFRLRPTAEATDRCPVGTASDAIDFEGDARPLEGPLSNLAGPYDVGFDEYNERFFRDGFED